MAAEPLTLRKLDLLFFRFTCDLFTNPESPLRFIENEPSELDDPETVFTDLGQRGLLNEVKSGASPHVLERLAPVTECDARVVMRVGADTPRETRNFYVSSDTTVEYDRVAEGHRFGPPRSEAALAVELSHEFTARPEVEREPLRMSAGDYLVFAVFARDVRETPAGQPEDAMSVDEVLAFFDEPETSYVRGPTDDSWDESVTALTRQGVLVDAEGGYTLHESLHPLAREIAADRQHTVTRFDFLDDQWLVREVNLYPTEDSVYRLGSQPDGSVLIQELSTAGLADVLAGVVSTLPNLLNPEVSAELRGSPA